MHTIMSLSLTYVHYMLIFIMQRGVERWMMMIFLGYNKRVKKKSGMKYFYISFVTHEECRLLLKLGSPTYRLH